MGPSSQSAAEDFLFHLYRGSELLQDSRVHEAKEELENALRLQPRDPKGQDLLAVVYFRLGLYPHAIEIYEELFASFPGDPSLGNNLALCYLKTGQPEKARTVLEAVVTAQPDHLRAWSYLGLAFERLGDYAKAKEAFERGQQQGMARRMAELVAEQRPKAPPPAESTPPERAEVREAAGDAFHELDNGYVSFSIAAPAQSQSGTWRAVEPGQAALPPPSRSPTVPGMAAVIAPAQSLGAAPPPTPAEGAPAPARPAPTASELVRDSLLAFPREARVAPHPSGCILARLDDGFATRLEAIRAFVVGAGGVQADVLSRRARGRGLGEPLGGAIAPIVSLAGTGHVVLGARGGHRLVPIVLEDEFIYLREEVLAGFDGRLAYESGRLPVGEGEAVPMVQLNGRGAVVLEIAEAIASLEVTPDRSATVRREAIIGWTGRLVPHALPPSDSPAGARGLVSFAGQGAVLAAIPRAPGAS